MTELARSYGGECLSTRYINLTTPLKWRCAEGHVWKAAPSMVKPSGYQERGTWCPECAKAPRYSLDDMHELAASRGGRCLSPLYINNDTPLEWCCVKGHRLVRNAKQHSAVQRKNARFLMSSLRS